MKLFTIVKHMPNGATEWYRVKTCKIYNCNWNHYQIRVWEKRTGAEQYIKRHAKQEERESLEIVVLTIEGRKEK